MNNGIEVIGVLGIIVTFTAGIVLFVRSITTYYLRKKMVEKGYVDKDSIAILESREKDENRMNTLKWGLVVFFAGLALIILEFIDYASDSPLPYGIFILSVSAGLLLHFYISTNVMKNNKE